MLSTASGDNCKNLKRRIFHIFTKTHGLSLQTSARKFLENDFLLQGNVKPDEVDHVLDIIASALSSRSEVGVIEEKDIVDAMKSVFSQDKKSVASCSTYVRQEVNPSSYIKVHDLFSKQELESKILGEFNLKWISKSMRLKCLRDRAMKSEMFCDSESKVDNRIKLSSISSLLGSSETKYLMGFLVRNSNGLFILEDENGSVELDLSCMAMAPGFITEGSAVLVEGKAVEGRFRVNFITLPPALSRQLSLARSSRITGFSQDLEYIRKLEQESDYMFVFVQDLWLDVPQVMEKLDILFQGYNEIGVPCVFVLMGEFQSKPWSASGGSGSLKDCLGALGDIISRYRHLMQNCEFVFVPGNCDPCGSNVVPRPKIPDSITQKFRMKVPRSQFVSNPCRISFCTQEMVIYRENMLGKMRRNCIISPDSSFDHRYLMFRSLIDGCHLLPFPASNRPTIWSLDDSLLLDPSPDVLVVGDEFETIDSKYSDTVCLNPGSFSGNGYRFIVYYPSSREVEHSSIQNNV